MRDEHADALTITGEIYDAALDPDLWRGVLKRISAFVGGPATALVSHDVAAQTNRFHFVWGDDPDYSRLYCEKYVRLNPLLPAMMMMKVGEVWSVSRIMPMSAFHGTRFYQEWVKPQGQGDNVWSLVERSGTVVTTLNTVIDEEHSPASDRSKRRMALLVPHVRRAVAIGNVIKMSRIEADALGDAVDAIGAAVYLVGSDGKLVRENDCARALMRAGLLLRTDGGVLGAADEDAHRELKRAIERAGAGDRVLGPRGTAIALADRHGERFVAHVLPLTSGARRRAGLSTGAAAAVFVHKAEMNAEFPIEAVARQFALSPAELRVLVGVLEVGPPAEIAPMLGLSEATVRTHLRRLYAKTGASRQADLVKLVAGYASPIVAPAPDRQTASHRQAAAA